jgi:NAD+ diphosphatase
LPRRTNVFAGPYVDRAAHLRKDPAWLEAALAEPGTLIVPLWRQMNLIDLGTGAPLAALIERRGVAIGAAASDAIYLGRFRERTVFAVEWTDDDPPPTAESSAEFRDLRMLGAALPGDEAGLLAYARAMVLWRARHRFCGTCGTRAASSSGGHVMVCTNDACGAQHFPRLDPAIIVLVTDRDDGRALLGRQASWPPGRYSTIAGFVEPGESLEDAVAREVLEETGVEVESVEYHSSQPWPFPSSLMIGYEARAGTAALAQADDELEDVQWFSREEIAAGHPALPPPQSISFRLIEDWYNRGARRSLADEPRARLWDVQRRAS